MFHEVTQISFISVFLWDLHVPNLANSFTQSDTSQEEKANGEAFTCCCYPIEHHWCYTCM